MINLYDIRYARLGTQDLEGAIKFASSIVGLQLVTREGNAGLLPKRQDNGSWRHA